MGGASVVLGAEHTGSGALAEPSGAVALAVKPPGDWQVSVHDASPSAPVVAGLAPAIPQKSKTAQ